jgi:cytochrome c oxidase subunit IV
MSDVTAKPPKPLYEGDKSTYHVDPGKGWVLFAGIMLAVIGALNVIYGIAAIGNSKVYVRDVEFIFANLNTWGWLLLIIGVAQLVTAFGVFTSAEWARWLGIGFASANLIIQFFVMPAHPVWAVMVLMIDVIIIFGLATYGGRDRYSLDG